MASIWLGMQSWGLELMLPQNAFSYPCGRDRSLDGWRGDCTLSPASWQLWGKIFVLLCLGFILFCLLYIELCSCALYKWFHFFEIHFFTCLSLHLCFYILLRSFPKLPSPSSGSSSRAQLSWWKFSDPLPPLLFDVLAPCSCPSEHLPQL